MRELFFKKKLPELQDLYERSQNKVEKFKKEVEKWQKQVERLVDLINKVDAHGNPCDLASKVTSLQWSLNGKEKSLKNENSTEEELSSKFTAAKEDLKKERQHHREHVNNPKKDYDDVIDEVIKGVECLIERM